MLWSHNINICITILPQTQPRRLSFGSCNILPPFQTVRRCSIPSVSRMEGCWLFLATRHQGRVEAVGVRASSASWCVPKPPRVLLPTWPPTPSHSSVSPAPASSLTERTKSYPTLGSSNSCKTSLRKRWFIYLKGFIWLYSVV